MKKILSAILALLLICLSGCGAAEPAGDAAAETEAPASAAEAPEETSAPSPSDGDADDGPDFTRAYAEYAPETPVMTVDGVEIDWREYFDALFQYAQSFYLYYGVTDFSMELSDGFTVGDWLREMTEDQLRQLALLYAKAGELGLGLTAEDTAAIDEEIRSYAETYYGGDAGGMFTEPGASEEYYRFQAGGARLYDKLLAHYFGEGGAALSDEDAEAYITENGYLYAKHILFKTVDDAGSALDDETVASKRAAAEETLARLRAADPAVLPELFDTLMNSLSEDTGTLYYPDGYFFQEGEMIPEFYEAALALEEGQLSGIVEGAYGYHILYRPPISGDIIYGTDSSGNPYTLRYHVASALFGNILDESYDAQDIAYAPGFEALDVAALFSAAE